MKRVVISLALIFSLLVPTVSQASTAAKKFKNCTALNKVYPGGVAKPGAVNKGGTTTQRPTIDASLYKANIKSDRDKDGIACEK